MSQGGEDWSRYCPACDDHVDAAVCPIHGLGTTTLDGVPRADDLRSGQRFGQRYEIVRLLGRGAMGAVYVAKQLSVDRLVALKVMRPAAVQNGQESVRRFHQEASSASRLNHPNVVAIYDFGVDDELGMPFIAMEVVEGETLASLTKKRGPIPLGEAAAIANGIARGLATAHRLGVVHRDLKPENVLVRAPDSEADETQVKIVDFGIARSVKSSASDDGGATVLGTPRYMSPEQIRGEPVDGRADLYALGCVFYELVEGHPPFQDADTTRVMRMHLEQVPPPLTRLGSGPNADLAQTICRRLLAKAPSARPRDAVEVSRCLRALATDVAPSPSTPPSADVEPRVAEETLTGVTSSDSSAGSGRSAIGADSDPRDGSAPSPPSEARRGARRAWSLVAAVAVGSAILASVVLNPNGVGVGPERGDDPARVAAALGTAGKLACPIWEAKGLGQHANVLGAGAADALCRRARWYLGGRGPRVLLPAELLDFPAIPQGEAQPDPYDDPLLRPRSFTAARERGDAWVEGHIEREGDASFAATIRLHASGDAHAGPYQGRGRAPFEAAWAALDAAVSAGAVPVASELAPDLAYWWMFDGVEDGLLYEELHQRDLTGLGLSEVCRRALQPGRSPAFWVHSNMCPANTSSPQDGVGPQADLRLRGSDLRAVAWRTISAGAMPEAHSEPARPDAAARLERLRTAASEAESSEAKFLMLTAAALLLDQLEDPLALPALRQLIELRPDQEVHLRGMYATHANEERALANIEGQHAWEPSRTLINVKGKVPASLLPRLRLRSFIETGGKHSEFPWIAYEHGHGLIERGLIEEARAFAASLVDGHPVQTRNAVLLEAESDLAEGDFANVVAKLSALPRTQMDPMVVRHLYRVVALAPELARMAHSAFERVCDPDFDGQLEGLGWFASAQYRALNLLELAPRVGPELGRRCLAAFDAHRFGDEPFFADCRRGVELFLDGDQSGAVRAWRRIRPPLHGCLAPVDVIERFDPELAERVDARLLGDRTYGGAHPAQVREARRAARRGEHSRARELAQRIVEAWSPADVRIPAVDEMRQLSARPSASMN